MASSTQTIGPFRYHIPEQPLLAETRMSVLWLADALDNQQDATGEKVVLKIARLKEEQFSLVNQRAIANEGRWLRQLQHPGIIKLRPIAEEGTAKASRHIYQARSSLPGEPWFVVTDYLSGGTLESLVKARGKLTVALALQIARSLAETLAYVHTQGCVHRDFKPQNVLFTHKLADDPVAAPVQPILIDFGIANDRGDHQLISGTEPWLAPESIQARKAGVRQAADPAVDIYALGLTLYYMLTGNLPPKETLNLADLLKIPAQTLVGIANGQRPALADALNRLLQQMIAEQPAHRLTAPQVVSALDQLLAQSTQPTRHWFNGWRGWASSAAAIVLVLIIVKQCGPVVPPPGTPTPTPTTPGVVATEPPTLTVPATSTLAPTATATSIPTQIPPTATLTPSPTAVPPTATNTSTPTLLPSPTAPPTATPTLSPTLIATNTVAPTATTAPTSTPFATSTPDLPTATSTVAPTRPPPPAPTQAATLSLNEPLGNVLAGRLTFRWTTNVVLRNNQAFELIFWAVGQDPFIHGFSPVGADPATTVTVDLDKFAESEQGRRYLIQGRDYEWGVRLVERQPFRPLQYLGGGHRFRYGGGQQDGGGREQDGGGSAEPPG